MSVTVASNRLMLSSLNLRAGFYQQLSKRVLDYQNLGNWLISQAELSIAFRQIEAVEEIGLILSNLPLEQYRLVGQYYQAWCAYRKGDQSRILFENTVEQSELCRSRALLSLAAIETSSGNITDGLKLYSKAPKYNANPSTVIRATRGIAIIKAIEGNHKQALKDLESLSALSRYANPLDYFDYLNSYAVELSEAGRLEESKNAAVVVVSSPLARFYPEWQETLTEVKQKLYKSRSTVSIGAPKPILEPQRPITNVIQFPSGERMANDESTSELSLSALQALAMILRNVLKDRITEQEIEKICDGFLLALELLFTDEE